MEATAIGNALIQGRATGLMDGELSELRALVARPSHQRSTSRADRVDEVPMRSALFITRLADALFPEAGKATVRVLSGWARTCRVPGRADVLRPDACQHRISAAFLLLVERFAEVFAPYDAIVAPSGSCVGSVRHQHAMIAERFGSPGLVEQVEAAARTYELSEYFVDVLGVTDVGATSPTATYHPTCHSLRMLRVGDKPITLLQAVEALELVELPVADQCCGFGGTFAIKNSDTSTAMLADKMRSVLDTGGDAHRW